MFAILIVSLLILSHVLTDFYFQTDKLVKEKRESKLAVLKHSSHFLWSSLILTIVFLNIKLLLIIILVFISHYLIDILKISLDNDKKHLRTFLIFISDQLTHLLIILLCYPLFKDIEPNFYINSVITKVNSFYPFLELINNINYLSFLILATAGFLFTIRGGTILSLLIINLPLEKTKKEFGTNNEFFNEEIAATLGNSIEKHGKKFKISKLIKDNEEEKKRYGKTIGEIERIIIVTAMLINKFEIIVILTAIKSIGRFKELNNKTSDYYIVGTFASFSIAFLIGLFLLLSKKILLD